MIASKKHFSVALLQGLAVGLFVYVLLFTIALVKAPMPVSNELASITSTVMRPDITSALEKPAEAFTVIQSPPPLEVSAQTPALPLQDSDHAEVPIEQSPASAHADSVPAPPSLPKTAFLPSDMIEMTPQGALPKHAPNGLTPFEAYKKPFGDQGKPTIAIAIMDYGLSDSDSRSALEKLPPEVTLIMNPYAGNFDTWKSLAQAKGNEFWINVPIEDDEFPAHEDPGPQVIMAHSDFKYNQEKFYWALSRTSGYAGVAAFTDPAFLNSQSVLKALLDDAYNRGIGYFEINPSGLEGVEMNAIEKKAPYIRSNSLYDINTQAPQQWLAGLEREAVDNGFAIGVIRTPYPLVIEAIAGWAGGLESRGFALAPLSAFAAKQDAPASTPAAEPAHPPEQPKEADPHAHP